MRNGVAPLPEALGRTSKLVGAAEVFLVGEMLPFSEHGLVFSMMPCDAVVFVGRMAMIFDLSACHFFIASFEEFKGGLQIRPTQFILPRF